MKFLLSTALAVAMAFALVSTANAAPIVDQPVPLRLKIATTNGEKKLKVVKRMPLLISCSKDCRARIKMTLITPAVKDDLTDSGKLLAGNVHKVKFPLTRYGLNYLKNVWRTSKLRFSFVAKDLETGKRVVKTKTFRFYR
ncbi:MAG: hypothetical protein M3Y23_00615 [Actinomycetota bacterium]|nr:hypothetical protein [Actinomycetota bacterium]